MLVIGFANQYYTLWDCYTEVQEFKHGVRLIKEHNNYIKNISINKDKAFALYPDAQFDENLRGKTRSFYSSRKEFPNNVFHYGRYEGELYTNCHDYSYMAWYFEGNSIDRQEILKPILEKNGYYIYKWEPEGYVPCYKIMTIEQHEKQLKAEREREEARQQIIDGIKNGYLELFIECNIDENFEYQDYDSGLIFNFKEGKEHYYNGYVYWLPVLNGKAKRIKNKTIAITDAIIEDDVITINNFNVIKK